MKRLCYVLAASIGCQAPPPAQPARAPSARPWPAQHAGVSWSPDDKWEDHIELTRELLRDRREDVETLVEQIDEAMAITEGRERELLGRLRRVAARGEDDGLPAWALLELASVLEGIALQVGAESNVRQLAADSLRIAAVQHKTLARRALALYRKIARFNDAKAQFGLALANHGAGDDLGALRALKRCLDLEPRHAECERTYSMAKRFYVRPFCAKADIPSDLSFHRAQIAPSPGWRRIDANGERLFVDPNPPWKPQQLEQIVQNGEDVQLELVPELSKDSPLRVWSPSTERFVITRGTRVVLVVDKLTAFWGVQFRGSIEPLCDKRTLRALPEEFEGSAP